MIHCLLYVNAAPPHWFWSEVVPHVGELVLWDGQRLRITDVRYRVESGVEGAQASPIQPSVQAVELYGREERAEVEAFAAVLDPDASPED